MTEYTNTCGLAGSAQSFHIVNKSSINPAPAFRMTQGTRWIWFVPVRAVAPNTTADTIVSVWAKEFGVDDQTTSTHLQTFVGDPNSPVWQAYRNAPRVYSPTVNQTVDSLGAPDTAELGLPYQMGSYQRFGSFDNNQPSVITSYAPWGTHVVAGH